MNEVFVHAEKLRNSPDLLGWVIFVMVCIVLIRQHKRILAYFDARIESWKARQQDGALMAELIRNNTAALENNTQMLSILKQDRREMVYRLETHDEDIKESVSHLQTVINRIDKTVSDNHTDITLIADRTK